MVLQRNSFYACTSPAGTLENSFQRRLSEMPARLYTITVDCWKLSPDRFSWNRCPIILSSRATRKTTCYALFDAFFFFFFFFQRKIFVRFSRNLLPRSTGYQIPFLTRYYSEQLRFFVYPFTKFYAVEKQSYVRIIIIVTLSESNLTSPV